MLRFLACLYPVLYLIVIKDSHHLYYRVFTWATPEVAGAGIRLIQACN